jgi:drug/metabolite transporter (DMT)-like permease
MEYLLIPLGCALASLKVTLQSKFSKSGKHTLSQNVFFTAIMFATISLMFIPTLFDGGISIKTLFYATLLGSFSLLYQILYVITLSMGRMTLTVIINNFGMLIPMIVSIVFLNDEFTILIGIGAALALISLCLTVVHNSKKGRSESKNVTEGAVWLVMALLVFLANGLASVAQKLYTARAGDDFQIFEFVCLSYMIAAAEAFVVFAVLAPRDKKQGIKLISKSTVVIGCAVGAALGIFQCVNTCAMSLIPAPIYYPSYNCGTALLLALIGAILFKERFTVRQYIGIALGVAAIVLLCL